MGVIIFNGTSSKELGLISQATPAYEFPEKKYAYTHVPGRTGDIIYDDMSYSNVERTYYLACIYAIGTDLKFNAENIISWLMSAKGYARLEDSYEPDVFRLASYVNNGALGDIYRKATTINVTFNCKPQRYLKIGEEPLLVYSSETLNYDAVDNPTKYDSLPIIKVQLESGVTNAVLTISNVENTYTKTISIVTDANFVADTLIIDTETQQCYGVNNNDNYNGIINLSDDEFPVLKTGITTLTVSGTSTTNIEEINIIPRWWKL